jgi:hypothetical protein
VPEAVKPVTGPAPGDALLPDLPISPWETVAAEETRTLSDIFTLSPPALAQSFTLSNTGGPQFSFDYRFTPTTASELQFRSSESNWREPEDIDWGEVSTILSRFRSDGNLGFNVKHTGSGAYSGSFQLSGTGSWQDYMFLNEDAEEFTSGGAPDRNKIKTARNRAYNETFFTSSWDVSTTIKPFYQSSIWGNTSLQYGLKGLLGKTSVDTAGNNPVWEWVRGEWHKEDITNHQLSATMAASVMDYAQSFSVSAELPPKDAAISTNAAFRAWITETSVRNKILFPFDSEERKIEPVYFTETFKFGSWGSFQQYLVYDPEESEYTTLTSTLSLSGFSASFSALYAQPYEYNYNGSVDFNRPNGWILLEDKGLHPHEFKLGFNKSFTQKDLWDNRISFTFSPNVNLAFDLQRYTNSRLTFSLGFTIGIMNFLDVKLSTNSENAVIFRYFQNLPFFDLPVQLYPGQETNFFVDLANSFRLDNADLRRRSGFKMKALNLSLVHFLGDWNATLAMKMTPYLPSGSMSYQFDNEISFLVQWVPIKEIKTQIDYVKETLTVK